MSIITVLSQMFNTYKDKVAGFVYSGKHYVKKFKQFCKINSFREIFSLFRDTYIILLKLSILHIYLP